MPTMSAVMKERKRVALNEERRLDFFDIEKRRREGGKRELKVILCVFDSLSSEKCAEIRSSLK